MRAHRFPALLLLALALPACSHAARSAENAPPSPTVLRVSNGSPYDFGILMVRQTGDTVRLGGVRSQRTAYLTIPSGMVVGTGMARFIARTIGPGAGFTKLANTGLDVAEDIAVSVGDTVTMSITR